MVHSNLITLRSDMKGTLEDHVFTFAPRGNNGEFVAFFLQAGAQEATHLYHNRVVRLPQRVDARHLYCRFAWTILNLVQRYCKSPPLDFVVVPSVLHAEPALPVSCDEDAKADPSSSRAIPVEEEDGYSVIGQSLHSSDSDGFIMPSPPERLFFTDTDDMERRLEQLESQDASLSSRFGSQSGAFLTRS